MLSGAGDTQLTISDSVGLPARAETCQEGAESGATAAAHGVACSGQAGQRRHRQRDQEPHLKLYTMPNYSLQTSAALSHTRKTHIKKHTHTVSTAEVE